MKGKSKVVVSLLVILMVFVGISNLGSDKKSDKLSETSIQTMSSETTSSKNEKMLEDSVDKLVNVDALKADSRSAIISNSSTSSKTADTSDSAETSTEDEESVVVILPSTSDSESNTNSDNADVKDNDIKLEDEKNLEGFKWILNTNTKKIHKPECGSVKDMKPSNAEGSDEELDYLKSIGYAPCQRCLKDAYEVETPPVKEDVEYHWVLNTNTKKIHKIGCSSINDMKESNKADSYLSIAELESQGYVCCKRCFK